MNYKLLFGIILLSLLSNVLVADTALPGWVADPPSKPGFRYGIGSASLDLGYTEALEIAKTDAKNDLASTLKINIGSTIKLENTADSSGTSSSFKSNVRIKVPDIALTDLRIIEVREVASRGTLFALAELDISAIASRVAASIQELLTAELQRESPSAKGAAELRHNFHVLRTQLQVAALKDQLALLNATANIDTSGLDSLIQTATTFFDGLTIAINQKEISSAGRDVLAEGLTQSGFKLSNTQNDAYISVTLAEKNRTRNANEAFYCNSSVTLKMSSYGQLLSTAVQKSKGVSGDQDIACEKAVTTATQAALTKLLRGFWDALENPTPNQS